MQALVVWTVALFVCLAARARGEVQAVVTHQSFDPTSGGNVTLSIDRAALCCSAWDWVGIYRDGDRLSYEHSQDDTSPTFTATLAVPSTGGTFTFVYRTSVDGWQVHDLGLEVTFADPAATSTSTPPLPAGVSAVVTGQAWDDHAGGSITLTVARGPDVCCSPWDWVGIYQNGARLSFEHSQDDTSPTFTATLAVPSTGGTFTFAYSTSVDGWLVHDLNIEYMPRGVTALVAQQAWDAINGGSVTLTLLRGAALCCSAWDWVGIYRDGDRLSYEHSQDDTSPTFTATLAVPSTGGTFTFVYRTSVDGWQVHDLGLELQFGVPVVAPAIPMATIIPSYWWPTDASWDELHAAFAASGLPAEDVIVILNPNSGNITFANVPSSASWALWRDRAANLTSTGFKPLAYVNLCSEVVNFSCAGPAQQGNKNFSGSHGVKAEIDKYVLELGSDLRGVFFDDAGHTGHHTDAILEATSYAQALGLEVVHNPGAWSEDAVLFDAANATVLRESSDPGDANPLAAGLPAEKSVMLLHSVASSAWRDYFDQARSRGFKYFYAADTWSSCPTYLEEQLAAIASTHPTRRLSKESRSVILV